MLSFDRPHRPTHRPWGSILALAVISVVLIPAPAHGEGMLDQSQTVFTSAAAGTCEDERLAQTFTSGLTGGLDRVDIHLWRDNSNTSADLHVQLQSVSADAPSGTVLASGSVPLASIGTTSGSPNFVTIRFDPPANVVAGRQYAIVVLESGLPCTQGYWWDFADGLTYPRGEALSLAFGAWIEFGGDNGQDFAFKTYVDTAISPDEPSVQIAREQVRIGGDGSVPVTVFARCRPGLNAFELDVSVSQGSAFGSETILGPGVTPCDGSPHRLTVSVSPDSGRFGPGPAIVDVFLGLFDPVEGDLEATDTATVELLASLSCRVKNVTQDSWFATTDGSALTDAISHASPGDRLNVFGTCVGTYTLDRNLNITGSRSTRMPTTIDAAGTGRALVVQGGVTASLGHLTITGGEAPAVGGGGGILISEGATVTLVRSVVAQNMSGGVGGGIVNGGTLTVIASFVGRNHAAMDGGGIFNYGDVVLIASGLSRNIAEGVGGGLFNEGSAVLDHSRVRFNRAESAGGILNVSLLTLRRSVVSDNHPDDCEGC